MRAYRFGRVRRQESMDAPGLDPGQREAALAGLRRIASWPGQRRPILRAILGLLSGRAPRRFRVIELGAGSGHLSAWLAEALGRTGIQAEFRATDRVPAPGVEALDACGPLPEADIYFSNLMWHHLGDADLVKMLRGMEASSGLGWLGYDLQRHWLHYYGAAAAMRLAGLPPINLEDGAASIQQGYSRRELQALLSLAGCAKARIAWTFPFRWMVTRDKRV